MIRRQELGLSVPDFKQATDTYFLDWMRFGLQEFDEYKYPSLVARVKLAEDKRNAAIFENNGCSETGATLQVNFFAKLKRVCCYEAEGHANLSGYNLLVATCRGTIAPLPAELRPF